MYGIYGCESKPPRPNHGRLASLWRNLFLLGGQPGRGFDRHMPLDQSPGVGDAPYSLGACHAARGPAKRLVPPPSAMLANKAPGSQTISRVS